MPTTSSSGKKQKTREEEAQEVGMKEDVLLNVYKTYVDGGGLIEIGKRVGDKILEPRKKVTVMLIGNHSAGKSTFINWYINDAAMQKTGVAIETRKFSIITNGKREDKLRSHAALKLPDYKHFEGLNQFTGLIDQDNLEACISISGARQFKLADFIDTPGLVDGEIEYAYAVEDAIEWVAAHVDVILVFLDPIGQGLCRRTMNVIQQLDVNYGDKMHYYLAKADEVGNEIDRQKLLIQITQNLSSKLNNKTFDLPTIYIPSEDRDKFLTSGALTSKKEIPNDIHNICRLISDTVHQKVQLNMKRMGETATALQEKVKKSLQLDEVHTQQNRASRMRGMFYYFFAAMIPAMFLLGMMWPSRASFGVTDDMLGGSGSFAVRMITTFSERLGSLLSSYPQETVGTALISFLMLVLIARFTWKPKPTLSKHDRVVFSEDLKRLDKVIKKHDQLYDRFMKELVADQY